MALAEEDAVGLVAFPPWRVNGPRGLQKQVPLPPPSTQAASQRQTVNSGGYGDFLRARTISTNAMDAIGLAAIPSWTAGPHVDPRLSQAGPAPAKVDAFDNAGGGGGVIPVGPKSGGLPHDMSSMRNLIVQACEALGKDSLDGEHWLRVLERQWITKPLQLKGLSNAEWTQLNLPCGLRNELRTRVLQMEAPVQALNQQASLVLAANPAVETPNGASQVPQEAKGFQGPKSRPKSAMSRLQRPIRQEREVKPSVNVRRTSDVEMIRKELQQTGGQWGPKLRKALVKNERVSSDTLQAALLSVGLKRKTDPELHSLMRAADPSGSGVPSLVLGRDLLRVLAGPLNQERGAVVAAVYRSLDVDGSGAVPVAILRRRFVATEHPDFKSHRTGAREIQQQILSQWRGHQGGVDIRSFAAAHQELSLAVPQDKEFASLLSALWSCHPDEGIASAGKSKSNFAASESHGNHHEQQSAAAKPQVSKPSPSGPDGAGVAPTHHLTDHRAKIVRHAFNSVDQDSSGRVSTEILSSRFLADRHPDVKAGRLTRHEVLREFLGSLISRSKNRGFITEAEFVAYYEEVSAKIDRDEYFQRVVELPWGLAGQANDLASRNRRLGLEGKIKHTEQGLVGF